MWDPQQYLRFAEYRTRPAVDLLARVALADPTGVYDLGCGPGNATRLLAERWPGARITGIDSSEQMLERARAALPGVTFVRADIATWRPAAPAGVIFSNAALHWLGGHERIFPDLARSLSEGGVLAVQMPTGFGDPWHALMEQAAREDPRRDRLEPLLLHDPVGPPTYYYDLLAAVCRSVDVWTTEYVHVLEGDDPVKEWAKGSSLKPLLDALPPGDRERFERRYAELVARAYPRRPDGRTLFFFHRLFIVAER